MSDFEAVLAEASKDHDKVAKVYDQLCRRHGDSPLALGWRDTESQRIRFDMLTLVGELEGRSVLDVGCGQGDFAGYLDAEGISVDYAGIDLSAEMVGVAHQKFQGRSFTQADFADPSFQQQADFVMASGCLSTIKNDQMGFLTAMVTKMFNLARRSVAFNLLSIYAPSEWRAQELYYYDPVVVINLCFKLTRYVELKHSYLPHDFTIYLHRP